jgi:DNA-binding MarR family transcriptional regulator
VTEREKLELSRVINATGLVLRRYFYRRLFVGGEDESLPALTPPQVEMIVAIHAQGSMSVKQLAQVLCVKAPSASTRVERLVEMGLLTREENPADRREVLVKISPKESALIHTLEKRKLQAGWNSSNRWVPNTHACGGPFVNASKRCLTQRTTTSEWIAARRNERP